MRKLLICFFLVCYVPCARSASPATTTATSIIWDRWSDDIFQKARKQHKLVLLNLGAVWCHWCHVMDETTYQDPDVIRLMNQSFLPVFVDQDSRPDLASRYEEYGWPATIVFDPDGKEIVKRQGYLPPKMMASMLQAIIDDPTPGPSVRASVAVTASDQPQLTPAARQTMQKKLFQSYDEKQGAWGSGQKYLNWDNLEYCLDLSNHPEYYKMARQTLTAQLQLLDPVWGGVYQYSTNDDWVHPHFEKIMQMQTQNLRIDAMAYRKLHDPQDLHAAMQIQKFMKTFLTAPNGAFYTSQDADLVDGEHSAPYFALDDAGRRKAGIPRIDEHQYARENGWAIAALCELTDDPTALTDAITAANWVIANRSLTGGGFRHDESDPAGPYLGDTLAMGQACLALCTATADTIWLDRASAAADFINAHFQLPVGVAASESKPGQTFTPSAEVDENIGVVRFANLLFYCTGNKTQRALADHAMKYVASPQVAAMRGYGIGGILLADREMASEPLHLAVVGTPADPQTQALLAQGRKYFSSYKRIELIDPAAQRGRDSPYPILPHPAAFLCAAGKCSSPIQDVQKLKSLLDKQIP